MVMVLKAPNPVMLPDPEYVRQRTKLIPEAFRYAKKAAAEEASRDGLTIDQQRMLTDRIFLKTMDDLCKERIHKKGCYDGES